MFSEQKLIERIIDFEVATASGECDYSDVLPVMYHILERPLRESEQEIITTALLEKEMGPFEDSLLYINKGKGYER